MKSEYRYAELVGPLKTTVNILNTTQIPVKCDWIGNVSLSDYLTFTPTLKNVMEKVILTASKKQE